MQVHPLNQANNINVMPRNSESFSNDLVGKLLPASLHKIIVICSITICSIVITMIIISISPHNSIGSLSSDNAVFTVSFSACAITSIVALHMLYKNVESILDTRSFLDKTFHSLSRSSKCRAHFNYNGVMVDQMAFDLKTACLSDEDIRGIMVKLESQSNEIDYDIFMPALITARINAQYEVKQMLERSLINSSNDSFIPCMKAFFGEDIDLSGIGQGEINLAAKVRLINDCFNSYFQKNDDFNPNGFRLSCEENRLRIQFHSISINQRLINQ